MKHRILLHVAMLLAISTSAQNKYSAIADIQPLYKDTYTFSAKLDEKTNTLSFETNAPVTVVTLTTYTADQLAVRKGVDYENTFVKRGQVYSYDLKKPALNNKYAYWLKVSWGRNGAPLGEYFFRKVIPEQPTGKPKVDDGTAAKDTMVQQDDRNTNAVLKTTIKCDAGKTKVATALKGLDGIFGVGIDIKTGIVKLKYSSDGTSLNDIIDLILANGFDVLDDGKGSGSKKSTQPIKNPCYKKLTNN